MWPFKKKERPWFKCYIEGDAHADRALEEMHREMDAVYAGEQTVQLGVNPRTKQITLKFRKETKIMHPFERSAYSVIEFKLPKDTKIFI